MKGHLNFMVQVTLSHAIKTKGKIIWKTSCYSSYGLELCLDNLYHILYLLVYPLKVGIQNTLLGVFRIEVVEFRDRIIAVVCLLCLDLFHVKRGLAKDLGGSELFSGLNIHQVPSACLRNHEIPGSLATQPSGSHITDFGGRNKAVYILIEIDGCSVPVNGNAFFELYDLSEDVARQPIKRFF